MNLYTKLLSTAERKDVFRRYMKYDFPYEELRPLRMIQDLVMKGVYYMYGIYEKETLRAYACFWEEKETNILLFDYFAVNALVRNQGYGTEAMKIILESCKNKNGVILEVENPEAAQTEEERSIREKRVAFYKRCGMKMSDVVIWLYGVEYCMLYYDMESDGVEKEIIKVMQNLYQNVLPKPVYRKMFKVLSGE